MVASAVVSIIVTVTVVIKIGMGIVSVIVTVTVVIASAVAANIVESIGQWVIKNIITSCTVAHKQHGYTYTS